jgi:hypothetical protein
MNDKPIILSSKAFDALLELLENPPIPNEALKKLLSTPAPWEKQYESTTRVPRRRRGRRSVVVGRRTALDVYKASRVERLKDTTAPSEHEGKGNP